MAKKGDWVRIHNVVLKSEQRTGKLPEDTKSADLLMWTKGYLQEDEAKVGDYVTVETACGRLEKGELIEERPHYTHSYGDFVPEIIEIDKQLRKILRGGDK